MKTCTEKKDEQSVSTLSRLLWFKTSLNFWLTSDRQERDRAAACPKFVGQIGRRFEGTFPDCDRRSSWGWSSPSSRCPSLLDTWDCPTTSWRCRGSELEVGQLPDFLSASAERSGFLPEQKRRVEILVRSIWPILNPRNFEEKFSGRKWTWSKVRPSKCGSA